MTTVLIIVVGLLCVGLAMRVALAVLRRMFRA